MKKYLLQIVILLATLFLSSCTQNETEVKKTDGVPLIISTNLTGTRTRGAISNIPANALMGLYVTSGNIHAPYQEDYMNVAASFNGSEWKLTPEVYLTRKDAMIFAYYPYMPGAADGEAIPVDHVTQNDYLCGQQNGSKRTNSENPTVNLTMKHTLSLIQFKINKKNYAKPGILSKIEICNIPGKTALFSNGTMNVTTGIITPGKENASAMIENSNGLYTIQEYFPTDEALFPKVLVMPLQDISENSVCIKFTVDYYDVFTYVVPAGTNWNAGSKSTYTITFTGVSFDVKTLTISDWEPGIKNEAELF